MFSKLKQTWLLYQTLKKQGKLPKSCKWLVLAAVAYLLLPFDLITDFIPGIGQIDDLLIVGTLIYSAIQRMRGFESGELKKEHTIIDV